MSDLQQAFQAAATAAQSLPTRPSNEDLLSLYALFKQATVGDVQGRRPGMFDLKGGAKYDAWKGIQGTGPEAAMQAYVDLVTRLQQA